MKSETATRFDYVAVEHLEVGQTIINLGIIKAIYPHNGSTRFQILFNPSRGMVTNKKFEHSHLMWYSKGDKLMIA